MKALTIDRGKYTVRVTYTIPVRDNDEVQFTTEYKNLPDTATILTDAKEELSEVYNYDALTLDRIIISRICD